MFVLNLVDLAASEIPVEVLRFPDGQRDVRLSDFGGAISTSLHILRDKDVKIYARVNSGEDLLILLSATAALRRFFVKNIYLHLPYLLGARSDRQFVKGGTSWLVDVLAPVLNAQGYRTINCFDVHSDVAAGAIKNQYVSNLLVESNASLVEWAIAESGSKNYVLAIPDAGALKKIYPLAEEIGYTGPLIVGHKHRDLATGKILTTTADVPSFAELAPTSVPDIFVVDDICDGGRTFLELVKAIQGHLINWPIQPKFYLVVSHGIFSSGYKQLGEVFEHIYTTNSYKKVEDTDYDGYHTWPTKVSQLNVF